jgi:hypothetical protein
MATTTCPTPTAPCAGEQPDEGNYDGHQEQDHHGPAPPDDYVGLKGGVKSATDGVEVEVHQFVAGPTRFRQGWEVYHFLFENDRLIGWTEV